MLHPTPTSSALGNLRLADFATLTGALDHAARGASGMNFYSASGELTEAVPYRDLRDDAIALARKMIRAGLKPGDRLALIASTDGAFVRAFCACQYAGLVPAPLPLPVAFGGKAAYVAQLRRMLDSTRASGALAPPAYLRMLAAAAEGLTLKLVGTIDALAALPEDGVDLTPRSDSDLCYLQFSSGSTRFPLGVGVTQRALMSNARGICRDGLRVGAGDRCASWLPFYHDMGLVGFMLAPLAAQLTVDYLPTSEFARRPLLWPALIGRNGATLSFSPTFGYELCARRAETASTAELDLATWRVAGIGGDMIRPGVMERFAERFGPCGFRREAFVASYGMAEATLAVSFAPLDRGIELDIVDVNLLERGGKAAPPAPGPNGNQDRRRSFVLCGAPLPGHEIEIRDGGRVLPERSAGRVFVRGPSVMQGYFDKAGETARVLAGDGWLDTGDLGYRIGEAVVITGRAKDLIIINGRNVWPQDLEWSAEQQADGLRSGDVAAFSVDRDETEQVVLLVECRASDPAARAALRDDVIKVIRASASIDCEVVLVPPRSLPMTSSGKLSRSRAKQLYLRGDFATPAPAMGPRRRPAAGAAAPFAG